MVRVLCDECKIHHDILIFRPHLSTKELFVNDVGRFGYNLERGDENGYKYDNY